MRYLGLIFALVLLAGCFETEYGPLLAGRPVYNLIHLEQSYDTVCAIPSTASIDTSLDAHPEHKRNLLDFSIDDDGREVVRNHAHEAYGLSDFHAERRTDYDDERGEAWLTFIHAEHVQVPPEGQEFAISYRTGQDCLAENQVMIFPFVVDPEPPPMQIVAIPLIVDGYESKLDHERFMVPFYTTIMELYPVTEISMRNRAADDPDLRIIVPGDSPAYDQEGGTLDLRALMSGQEVVQGHSLRPLWSEHHRPREIFFGFYDMFAVHWRERYGRVGLEPLDGVLLGGAGVVLTTGVNRGYELDPPAPLLFFEGTAHEIGHAVKLAHAPCGHPSGVDPDYPHADGGLGGATMWSETRNTRYGYYSVGPLLSDEAGYSDVMSYCAPSGISPYHFKKALDWQVHGLGEWEMELSGSGHTGPSLVLSGYVDASGVPIVTAASTSPMPPYRQTGNFAVNVLDDAGFVVGETRFRSVANYAGSERMRDTWSVRVPLPASVGGVEIAGADGGLLSTARLELHANGREIRVLR